jgi:phosphonate transport system substrate-binding protein
LLPQHFLFNERRTTPEALFRSVSYGSHFENLAALWEGRVDVAVNNSTDLATFQETRQPAARGNIRVLWESPLVPNDVLMYRAGTPEPVKRALRDFFLRDYGRTDSEKELYRRASGIREFVAEDNGLLVPVAAFKFATERAAIEGNTTLSAVDRENAIKNFQLRVDTFARFASAQR